MRSKSNATTNTTSVDRLMYIFVLTKEGTGGGVVSFKLRWDIC